MNPAVPETVRLASVQMVSSTCVEDNVAAVRRLVAGAAAEGAQLVVLPEFFPMIGATDEARLAIRETPGQGPLQSMLAEVAARHGVWLVGGSIPLLGADPVRALNSTLVFGPQGSQIRTTSYGEERPVSDGHDEQAWSQNRRVEIIY